MTIKHIARNSTALASWQGMACEPVSVSLPGHRSENSTTAAMSSHDRKNQTQFAGHSTIKILNRMLLSILLLTAGLNANAQGAGSEGAPNGYSYEQLFAGKRFYWENPRTGSQFDLTFCSSGNYIEIFHGMFSSGSISEETQGRWQVYEDGGQVYLVKESREKAETHVVTQGSQTGSLRLDKQEYTVSNSNQCN